MSVDVIGMKGLETGEEKEYFQEIVGLLKNGRLGKYLKVERIRVRGFRISCAERLLEGARYAVEVLWSRNHKNNIRR